MRFSTVFTPPIAILRNNAYLCAHFTRTIHPIEDTKQHMPITIKDKEQTLTAGQLEDLFLSVEWSSGHYPDKLERAMQNYATVYSAWDGDRLVGLISAMDDGVMTAYIHYLLVRPDCQGRGIGRQLLEKVKEKYKDYLRIALMAYNKECAFYERCGFTKAENETPMFITSLWT